MSAWHWSICNRHATNMANFGLWTTKIFQFFLPFTLSYRLPETSMEPIRSRFHQISLAERPKMDFQRNQPTHCIRTLQRALHSSMHGSLSEILLKHCQDVIQIHRTQYGVKQTIYNGITCRTFIFYEAWMCRNSDKGEKIGTSCLVVSLYSVCFSVFIYVGCLEIEKLEHMLLLQICSSWLASSFIMCKTKPPAELLKTELSVTFGTGIDSLFSPNMVWLAINRGTGRHNFMSRMQQCFCIGRNGKGNVAMQWYKWLPIALSICIKRKKGSWWTIRTNAKKCLSDGNPTWTREMRGSSHNFTGVI